MEGGRKNKIIMGGLLVILLAMVFLTIFLNKDFIHEFKSAKDFKNTQDGILYFGKPSCQNCLVFEPVLKDMANEARVRVYYFNIDLFRKDNLLTPEEISQVSKDFKVEKVPSLVAIKDGRVIDEFDFSKFDGQTPGSKLGELSDFLNLNR